MTIDSFLKIIRLVVPRAIRNTLRRPRVTLGRTWSRVQYVAGRTRQIEVRRGWRVNCHPISAPSFDVFRTDPEQKIELDQFVERCTPGMHLLDVGAHWGLFTLAALQFGADGSRVLCIEPSDSAVKILKTNVRLNQKEGCVQVVGVAAGRENGYVKMLTTGAGGADFMVTPPEDRPDTVLIRQKTVSEICAQAGFTPTHVKIDVEGLEEEALLGAVALLEEKRPIVFLELHGDLIARRGKDPQAPLKVLSRAGYQNFFIGGVPVEGKDLEKFRFNARLVCTHELSET